MSYAPSKTENNGDFLIARELLLVWSIGFLFPGSHIDLWGSQGLVGGAHLERHERYALKQQYMKFPTQKRVALVCHYYSDPFSPLTSIHYRKLSSEYKKIPRVHFGFHLIYYVLNLLKIFFKHELNISCLVIA